MRPSVFAWSLCLLVGAGTAHSQPNPVWWNGFEFCPAPEVSFPDEDHDGWGNGSHPIPSCGQPPSGVSLLSGDCDDHDPELHPGRKEVCDGIDNDCDGQIDENIVLGPCYDGPPGTLGVGVCSAGTSICKGAAGLSCSGQILPSPEVLDGRDNDCDGMVDEDFELICDDKIDNDSDGAIDCDDPDCTQAPNCLDP